jgi:hypothetical protein
VTSLAFFCDFCACFSVWCVQVLKTGPKEATYADFLKELPEADCRYGVFDVEYEDPKTKAQRNKIAFYAWSLSFPLCLYFVFLLATSLLA